MKKKKIPKIICTCGFKWEGTKRKCDNCGAKLKKKKTLGKTKTDLQIIFNKWIRERDCPGEYFLCISCGEVKHKSICQAGHYYAVKGYDGLRFDKDNVHAECSGCNAYNESHLIPYGINLERKIGKERVQALHRKAIDYKMDGKKWTREELKEIERELRGC